ncbi:ShlB/FhaC/HecB family hemolysin secretion/activation protein [Massilia sp. CCM 8695]|uniref:ShlB/FhaC/HecB family hemolysin secretion/activation protein n=1 Tax=Massilia frigida TaxID=2609281 RepID=A0ABX0NFN6_9BURK|nr:ShlB/FhaC/HecB family hemolysin secretion/activation protein [Massilia frigida]NHZ82136.1 ShlB/FhaC/HecB family hemolysin secretion/activation protein [Massilia frigida]
MLNKKILPFALSVLVQAVASAQAPTAGSQMQQIPAPPVMPKSAPVVRIESGTTPGTSAADQVRIVVNSLRLTGARAYPEAELLALTGFQPANELTMSELMAMAAAISARYHRDGYLLAQVFLPPQDIKNGAVTMTVMEGQYGKIAVRNTSRLSDQLVHSQLAGLASGDVVTGAPLESRLLRLSDIAGVNIKSTLVPGASLGTSDLIVDVTPGQFLSGSVDADNAGNRYTGQYRVGASLNVNELLGMGDVLGVHVLTSGKGLNYARLAYQMQFGKARAGVAYSTLRYELSKEFAPLHAHGRAGVASAFVSYPLMRTRNSNHSVLLAYDDKRFHDQVDLSGSLSDKKAKVLMASVYGDSRDSVGGAGATRYSLTLSTGELDIATPALRAVDAATARSDGHYGKLGYSAERVQYIGNALSLSAAVKGQVASSNLDVSEKMELGGMNAVRAYPEGEAYADQGYVLSVEARLRLPTFPVLPAGEVQLIAFADTGTVTRDKDPWTTGPNKRTLSGAGLGIVLSERANYLVTAFYAGKLGSEKASSSPDRSGRFWIQAVKYF